MKNKYPNGISLKDFDAMLGELLKQAYAGKFDDKWDRYLKTSHDKFWDARDYANRRYSPIILDLNNDGIIGSTNVRKQHTNFDFDGKNTILEGTAWIDANDGFLVLDKNNNGKIDNGSELFGDNTLLSNGKIAKDACYNNQINHPHTF